MNTATRRNILRANALYLGLASIFGLLALDLTGIAFGRGPAAVLFAAAPSAGIGFVEAHGLALILAVLLWQAQPVRYAHLTAAAVMGLLGAANIVFWQIFVMTKMLPVGIGLTALHLTFAALQLAAASGPRARAAVEA
jgi:hypothetical protein